MKVKRHLRSLALSLGVTFIGSLLSAGIASASTHPKGIASSLSTTPSVVSVSRNDYGINVFSYDSQLNAPSTVPALKTLGMGMQQFPNANQWSWTTNSFRSGGTAPVSLSDWGSILSHTNNQGLFIFNYDENPTFTGGGSPADATALTQYIVQHHLPISAIVIGSEEYGPWDYAANMNPSVSAQYYAARSALIAQAIHSVDPAMKVGVSFALGNGPHNTSWDQTVLRQDGAYINFVSVHDYPNAQLLSNAALLSAIPGEIQSAMQLIHNEIVANVPPQYAKNIQTWVTEYNPYGEPGPQSLQSVYGAAMVESAMLWRAEGANRLFIWSFDGEAHVANTVASANWPLATNNSQPFGVFALVGDGMSPELPVNQFYPSGVALAQYMQAIGTGGTLSTWVTSSVIIGEVSHTTQANWFLFNESNTVKTITVNHQSITLDPASMTELTNQNLIQQTNATPLPASPMAVLQYQAGIPQFSSPSPTVYAGETVTMPGKYFAVQGSDSRVILRQNGVNYGAPGDAYGVKIVSWTPTTIQFVMPDGVNGPPLSPGNATLQVETNNNVISSQYPIKVGAVPPLPVSQVKPTTVEPGAPITVTGNNFGNNQGSGYVMVSQNGINYGGPGDAYKVSIAVWTNQKIIFTVPDGSSGPALNPGPATVVIANAQGLRSTRILLSVASPSTATPTSVPPASPSVTLASAYPGETVTIDGQGFGSTKGAGYVMVEQNGINYGGPGDSYKVAIGQWQNQSISLTIPNGSSGPALVPGPATIVVANDQGVIIGHTTLTITEPPRVPASLSSTSLFAPGQWVTVTGEGFGANQGQGYVLISQDGVNYGAPGDSYLVAVRQWTNSSITFLVPTSAFAVNNVWERQLTVGQSADVTIVTNAGLKSQTLTPIVVGS